MVSTQQLEHLEDDMSALLDDISKVAVPPAVSVSDVRMDPQQSHALTKLLSAYGTVTIHPDGPERMSEFLKRRGVSRGVVV